MSDFEQEQRDAKALWLRTEGDGPPNGPSDAPDSSLPDPLLIASYLDGRMDAAAREVFEQELAGNEASLDLAAAAREAMAAAPAPQVSNEALDRAVARAQDLVAPAPSAARQKKPHRGPFGWLRETLMGRPAWQPAGLAAAALLALVVVWQGDSGRDGGPGNALQTAQVDPGKVDPAAGGATGGIDERALDEFLAEQLDIAFLGNLEEEDVL